MLKTSVPIIKNEKLCAHAQKARNIAIQKVKTEADFLNSIEIEALSQAFSFATSKKNISNIISKAKSETACQQVFSHIQKLNLWDSFINYNFRYKNTEKNFQVALDTIQNLPDAEQAALIEAIENLCDKFIKTPPYHKAIRNLDKAYQLTIDTFPNMLITEQDIKIAEDITRKLAPIQDSITSAFESSTGQNQPEMLTRILQDSTSPQKRNIYFKGRDETGIYGFLMDVDEDTNIISTFKPAFSNHDPMPLFVTLHEFHHALQRDIQIKYKDEKLKSDSERFFQAKLFEINSKKGYIPPKLNKFLHLASNYFLSECYWRQPIEQHANLLTCHIAKESAIPYPNTLINMAIDNEDMSSLLSPIYKTTQNIHAWVHQKNMAP